MNLARFTKEFFYHYFLGQILPYFFFVVLLLMIRVPELIICGCIARSEWPNVGTRVAKVAFECFHFFAYLASSDPKKNCVHIFVTQNAFFCFICLFNEPFKIIVRFKMTISILGAASTVIFVAGPHFSWRDHSFFEVIVYR